MENLRKVILSTALTLSCATALAQNKISASGTVIDDTGQPVIGATEQHYGQYYRDAKFIPEKNEFFPIPYNQLFYIPGLYQQNKGYN